MNKIWIGLFYILYLLVVVNIAEDDLKRMNIEL